MLNPFIIAVDVAVGVTPTKALPFAATVNGVPALGFLALSILLNKPVNDVGYSTPNNPSS
jgi:hypothetical protein